MSKKLECVPEVGDFKYNEHSRQHTTEQEFSDHKSVMSSVSRFGSQAGEKFGFGKFVPTKT